MKIFYLFFILNREKFFRTSLLFRGLPLTIQKIFYVIYLFFRVIALAFLSAIVATISSKNILFFQGFQFLLLLSNHLVFSKLAIASNLRLESLDFLLGFSFNFDEKRSNRTLVSFYYSLASFMTIGLLNIFPFIFVVNNLNIEGIVIIGIVQLFSPIYSYIETQKRLKKIKVKNEQNWQIKLFVYAFVYTVGAVIYNYIHQYNFILSHILHIISLYFGMLFIFTVGLMVANLLFNQQSRISHKNKIYFFSGLMRDYWMLYIKNLIPFIFLSPLILIILPVSMLLKTSILILLVFIFFVPNLGNFPMISYKKMINNTKTFVVSYLVRIFLPLLSLFVVMGVMANLEIIYLFLGVAILFGMFIWKGGIFYLFSESGLPDSRKIDYIIFTTLLPLGILILFSFRGMI